MKHFVVALVLATVVTGCGGSAGPMPAGAPAPSGNASVSGLWNGTNTLTSVSGLGCVTRPAIMPYGLTLRQNGDSLIALVQPTGSDVPNANSYRGTIATTSLTLNGPDKDEPESVRYGNWRTCASGDTPDVVFFSGTISARLTGDTVTGTVVETYKFYLAGTNNVIGTAIVNAQFTATKLAPLP
jgi:hypothetical protein